MSYYFGGISDALQNTDRKRELHKGNGAELDENDQSRIFRGDKNNDVAKNRRGTKRKLKDKLKQRKTIKKKLSDSDEGIDLLTFKEELWLTDEILHKRNGAELDENDVANSGRGTKRKLKAKLKQRKTTKEEVSDLDEGNDSSTFAEQLRVTDEILHKRNGVELDENDVANSGRDTKRKLKGKLKQRKTIKQEIYNSNDGNDSLTFQEELRLTEEILSRDKTIIKTKTKSKLKFGKSQLKLTDKKKDDDTVKTKINKDDEDNVETIQTPNSESDANKKSKKKHKKPNLNRDVDRDSRTIFVGNLPLNVTRKDLETLFKCYGKVQSVRLRSAIPSKPGMSKKAAVISRNFHEEKESINGYVVMEDAQNAQKALSINGTLLHGHHIRVNFAEKKEYDKKETVFVGNLPFKCQEEELYQFFSRNTEVDSVRVVRDRETGICKGFGFVVFKSNDGVELAMKLNDEEFGGRTIRVQRLDQKKNKKKEKRTYNPKGKSFQGGTYNPKGKSFQGRTYSPKGKSFQGVKSQWGTKTRKKVQRKVKDAQAFHEKGKMMKGKKKNMLRKNRNQRNS